MIKCIVKDCKNHEHQGEGLMMLPLGNQNQAPHAVWICIPCWEFLTKANLPQSQLYRNAIQVGEANDVIVSASTQARLDRETQAKFNTILTHVERMRAICMDEKRAVITAHQKTVADRCPVK